MQPLTLRQINRARQHIEVVYETAPPCSELEEAADKLLTLLETEASRRALPATMRFEEDQCPQRQAS